MNAQSEVVQPESTGARLKALAGRRAEEFIDEIPQTLRRLRTLLLVISISVPVALGAAVFILWRAVS
jgi:hypothetical protein